jgi:hypothetical protein
MITRFYISNEMLFKTSNVVFISSQTSSVLEAVYNLKQCKGVNEKLFLFVKIKVKKNIQQSA